MTILHLSDTHNKHNLLKDLPKSDIIIHSGDVSEDGTESEVLDFLQWFCSLNYAHKIFIAGNHDFCLDGGLIEGLPENVHYLCHTGVEIAGIKFWGVPSLLSSELHGSTAHEIAQIPQNTDVLISHQPPYGILDYKHNLHFGNPELLKAVERIQPRYHLFGHIHKNYGIQKIGATTFVNAAITSGKSKIMNTPFLLEM
ncbi:MAG: metallophosphatase domain-containing protein [Bacteroidales bacterium]|jgi:predicted phosphodiesterase|nr:metallophosphatase domain-containing protein [Bacteroidales bacterium]